MIARGLNFFELDHLRAILSHDLSSQHRVHSVLLARLYDTLLRGHYGLVIPDAGALVPIKRPGRSRIRPHYDLLDAIGELGLAVFDRFNHVRVVDIARHAFELRSSESVRDIKVQRWV